jgi:hypothetical protein
MRDLTQEAGRVSRPKAKIQRDKSDEGDVDYTENFMNAQGLVRRAFICAFA